MINRIEVVKGAASTLYGSSRRIDQHNNEKTKTVSFFTADIFSTSWLETNIDLGYRANFGKKSRCDNWCKLF
jgi:outer membrane receptor for ferrienterochelin and colicins